LRPLQLVVPRFLGEGRAPVSRHRPHRRAGGRGGQRARRGRRGRRVGDDVVHRSRHHPPGGLARQPARARAAAAEELEAEGGPQAPEPDIETVLVLLPVNLSDAVAAGPRGQSGDERHLQELIDRLTDDDIGVREKAASDLAEFGKTAIPTLEKARGSTDIELRSRAASILRSIGENEIVGRHWHRGARVTLDFDRAPVAKVLEELEQQGHDKFKYDAAEFQEPMTVRVKDAPFWDALEAVCRAAPALTWEAEGDGLTFKAQR